MENQKCFVCNTDSEMHGSTTFSDGFSVVCLTCGLYSVSLEASLEISHVPHDRKYILSGVIRRSSDRGYPLNISQEIINEIIDTQPPSNPLEMIDILLLHVYHKNKTLDAPVRLEPEDYPIAFAKTPSEFIFLCNRAKELGYLKDLKQNTFRLEIDGWRRVIELQKDKSNFSNVFIAMWFSKKTRILREAIKASVKEAGYEPILADERDYTGNIMDFVLSNIRQSRFVIADFTAEPEIVDGIELGIAKIEGGVRGGIYYEAGFAKGLGLDVIHLCKSERYSKNRLHFDIEQDNTMFWKDSDFRDINIRKVEERQSASNLSEKLYDRIIRLFGPGPLFNNKS